ncbi:Sec63 Brl domain-containing protein [Bisporella sp. PMI_857]|nr:Sec63 Brl domain-containing protein [Bisporella sp. PMI_857]
MSSEYSYDEQGQFFPFFVVTIVGIVTLPLTYSILKPNSDPGATAPRVKSSFRPEHADLIDGQRKAQKRRERKLKRIITVIAGWAIMVFMVYLIKVTARSVNKIWNPYDILAISDSSSERQIKKRYRDLSLKHHPDKRKPDPSKNETMETINEYFAELTKAYKALTDEDIRNNYIQYGHPDGKQSFSIGIALPKFIVTDGNGKYVILVYAVLLGVVLPYLVGTWWYGTQRMSREKILIESANNLFREYDEDITQGGIITALSIGTEFQHTLKGEKAESNLGKLESRVLAESKTSSLAGGLSAKDRQDLQDLEGVRRKTLALLWTYLGRVELDDTSLNKSKVEVAPIAHALNNAFTAISLAYGTTAPILASFFTSQNLIQAVPPGASPLLQLPYFTQDIAQAIEGVGSRAHLTLQQYMSLPAAYRKKITVGKGLLTEEQYQTAVNVALQLPRFQVEKAFFKVTGEKYITPSSLVSLVIKGRIIPPGSENVPEVKPADLDDVDAAEDDLDALRGKAEDKIQQPPLAHAPFFPRDYSPRWHVFLTDSKQGKIAVPPFTFTTFDKPIYDKSGKPTFNMQTLKAQFQAPPQDGQYTFVLHLVCDSYVGFDTKMEVTLTVSDASAAVEIEAEDDISEPDEDSIAGQMSMLKNGGVPPPRKKKVQNQDDSSDEESDTDGEVVDDDTSETDTDTDEE